jgi:hypothetical protein
MRYLPTLRPCRWWQLLGFHAPSPEEDLGIERDFSKKRKHFFQGMLKKDMVAAQGKS